METNEEKIFNLASAETFLRDQNTIKQEDKDVSTGLGKDEIFRPEMKRETENIFETETETVKDKEPAKENKPGEEKKEGKPGGEGEARMLITVLDLFFSRVDDMIAGTNDVKRWKLDQQDKDDLVEIGALLTAEGKRLANTTFLFWVSMIVIFSGNVYSAWRYRKTGGEGFPEKKKDSDLEVEYINNPVTVTQEKKPRKKFQVDELGRYTHSGNVYLKAERRFEFCEFKDYDSLVDANGKVFIDDLFKKRENDLGGGLND